MSCEACVDTKQVMLASAQCTYIIPPHHLALPLQPQTVIDASKMTHHAPSQLHPCCIFAPAGMGAAATWKRSLGATAASIFSARGSDLRAFVYGTSALADVDASAPGGGSSGTGNGSGGPQKFKRTPKAAGQMEDGGAHSGGGPPLMGGERDPHDAGMEPEVERIGSSVVGGSGGGGGKPAPMVIDNGGDEEGEEDDEDFFAVKGEKVSGAGIVARQPKRNTSLDDGEWVWTGGGKQCSHMLLAIWGRTKEQGWGADCNL